MLPKADSLSRVLNFSSELAHGLDLNPTLNNVPLALIWGHVLLKYAHTWLKYKYIIPPLSLTVHQNSVPNTTEFNRGGLIIRKSSVFVHYGKRHRRDDMEKGVNFMGAPKIDTRTWKKKGGDIKRERVTRGSRNPICG
jgi:hypothetical protein